MPLPRIAVVGSINTDIIVRAGRLPAPGETVLGGEWIMAGGGKGANQAVAAARAGAEVSLVGRVGADVFGRDSIARLKAAGVNVSRVVEDTQHTSGLATIIVGPDGDNLIAVAQCANGAVSLADVDAAARIIAGADVLVVQMEIPLETVYHAIETAHANGTRVLVNPAPAPSDPIPQETLAMIDYLVPNETEAARIAGANELDTAVGSLLDHGVTSLLERGVTSLLERGVGHIIITLGARGAAIFSTSGRTDVPAYRVDAVDAVGAGDAFCGVLACGLAEGLDLPGAVRLANAAAAISVTRHGAQPSMPTRAEIATMLSTQ